MENKSLALAVHRVLLTIQRLNECSFVLHWASLSWHPTKNEIEMWTKKDNKFIGVP